MAGVFRNTADGRLTGICANQLGVTARTVANWRAKNDPRWHEWREKWESQMPDIAPSGRPPREKSDPKDCPKADDDQLGEGIEAEIFAARTECKRLRHLAASLELADRFPDAALVHRILDSKRDGLRKLSADNPDILARAGDLIPKAVLVAYIMRVKLMVEAFPRRMMAVVPEDQRSSLKPAMDKECAALCAAAQEIDLNK